MTMDEKTIKEIAGQLGISGSKAVSRETISRLENKSDAELTAEILKIREQLRANNVSYEKQTAILRNLMPMMDGKQKARLQKVIELMNK